jgi:nitric oxide reductase NorE protein
MGDQTAAAPRDGRTRIPGEPGVWILIFGEMTAFAALFCAFLFYRAFDLAGFAAGQMQLHKTVGVLNTLVLLTGSLFVARGIEAMRRGDTRMAPREFRLGIGSGVLFAALKAYEYTQLFNAGVTINSHPFFGFYFGLTALHLGHVLFGSLFLLVLATYSRTPVEKPLHMALAESAGIFWHMVDLLWLVIFALLYLVE